MNKVLNNIDIHVAFTPSGNHNENLVSKESLHESLGKIAKWKTDFHSVVWDGNASLINGHTVATNVPADAKFTDTVYELPPATTEALGGIIVGNNLSIDEDGVLSSIAIGETYFAGSGISITDKGDDKHLPSEYKQIQYIESNEFDQFLNTKILVTPDIRIECDCEVSDEISSAYQAMFGTKYNDAQDTFIFFTRFAGNNIPCFASPLSGEIRGTGFVYNIRTKIVMTQSNASWYINDALVGSINGSGNWSYDKPIILFGCAQRGIVESGCKGKCYEFKAYTGDTLTHDLIPCIKIATREVGMYDIITDEFCVAVDDGTEREPFIYGPDLVPNKTISNTGVTDVGYVSQGVISVTKDGMKTQIDLTQQLRTQVAALEELVASLQSELAELKTQVVYSDDVHYIKKISPTDYASSVHSDDVMYLLNDEFTNTEEGD
jgi:hypothetical protein